MIKNTVHELLTTYDVTEKSLCVNIRGNPIPEIFEKVKTEFQTKYPQLWEKLDYFNDFTHEPEPKIWDIDTHWLAVFYVTGESEGYYIHVEAVKDGKLKPLFLAKTLYEGEDGRHIAEQTANAISRIMKV